VRILKDFKFFVPEVHILRGVTSGFFVSADSKGDRVDEAGNGMGGERRPTPTPGVFAKECGNAG
jgi:hypothetical protein